MQPKGLSEKGAGKGVEDRGGEGISLGIWPASKQIESDSDDEPTNMCVNNNNKRSSSSSIDLIAYLQASYR